MLRRGNIPAQADRFEELHLDEFNFAEIFEREVPEESDEDNYNWFEDIDLDDPTIEEIDAMIEILGDRPSGVIATLPTPQLDLMMRRFLVVR